MSDDNDSPADRDRVRKAIRWAIVTFFSDRIASGRCDFHADELRQYVRKHAGDLVAPASPDRIMRDLRQGGEINYDLVSRSKSLYRATASRMMDEAG